MIMPLAYGLIIGGSVVVNLQREEQPSEPRIDPEMAETLYVYYQNLIKSYFSQYDLSEWIGQMNSDPWSLWLHYIIRVEKRKLFGLMPYSQQIAVAEITSEPRFAEQDMDARLQYNGLEIRVIDKDYKPIIEDFCKKYNKRFNEKCSILV